MSTNIPLFVDRVLLSSYTGFVYKVPFEVIRQRVLSEDGERRSCQPFEDLNTGEVVWIREHLLAGFCVEDAHITEILTACSSQGLRKSLAQLPTGIWERTPLYGNLKDPSWASIMVGGLCNSKCTFCYTDWVKDASLSTGDICQVIKNISGFRTVKALVLTGGEVTIHPGLLEIVEFAKRMDTWAIGLQTNGRRLKEHEFVSRLAQAGVSFTLLSLHGPTEDIHDSITRVPGSFREALSALENLVDAKIRVTTNTVICRYNYRMLPELVDLIHSIGGNAVAVRFSYPILEGAAHDNRNTVLVSLSNLQPFLRVAALRAHRLGMRLEVANMPHCIPDFDFHNVYTTEDLRGVVQASPFYQQNTSRGETMVKLQACRNCARYAHCPGIQLSYIQCFPERPPVHPFLT